MFVDVIVETNTARLEKPLTYQCESMIEPGCRVVVPLGSRKVTGLAIKCSPTARPAESEKEIHYRNVIEVIDDHPILTPQQMALADYLARWSIASVMSIVDSMLPRALAAKSSRSKPAMQKVLYRNKGVFSLSPSQQQAFEQIEDGMPLAVAKQKVGAYQIGILEKKGALRKELRPVRHGALPKKEQKPWPSLNQDQKRALHRLKTAPASVSLLHGVTGSGKTEVFFHLAKEAIQKGKQVLILVPEISLTPMMEERFASRFDCDLYSCHSRLSDSQMLSVWNSIASSGPCIVIGTRKSVFLPFNNLGLIVVDEEHDASYKQDSYPRYHCREAAIELGRLHECPVVLASATPSLESYARAMRKVYTLASLPNRAAGNHALIRLVDLRKVQCWNRYSADAIACLSRNLESGHKSLVLLNRRGYLPTVRCNSCHEYLSCPDCSLPLSYHKSENALVCHVCGRRYPAVSNCPKCGSPSLSTDGQGTERLEENTRELFPAAKIIRMDRDTTQRKGSHAALLKTFEESGDILLGTQMISKGLDYHDITLGIILSIDSVLSRPDYLSAEKAYQLAEQTAGRAGRGELGGQVLIQTFNPCHPVLRSIVRHDYIGFFKEEMRWRRAGMYPPYTFLGTVIISGEDGQETYNKAEEIAVLFEKECMNILGPAQISMRKGRPRMRLVFKDRSDEHLRDLLWQVKAWFEKNGRGFSIDINRNPASLEE